MLIQTIKKFLAIFIIFVLSFLQIISYTYDNFFVAYDTNTSLNTNIIKISKENLKKINSIKNIYNFQDGSKTTIDLKGLNISISKLDFITNYKGVFFSNPTYSETNLKSSKNDSTPNKVFLLTSNLSSKKGEKEKIIINNEFLKEKIITNNELNLVYNKSNIIKTRLSYFSRGPPIISLTLV